MSLSREIDIKQCQSNTKTHIYEFSYIFDTVLYQFLETGTSDRTHIGLDQQQNIWGFRLNSFSFYINSSFQGVFSSLMDLSAPEEE